MRLQVRTKAELNDPSLNMDDDEVLVVVFEQGEDETEYVENVLQGTPAKVREYIEAEYPPLSFTTEQLSVLV